jgi:hypothetical protein
LQLGSMTFSLKDDYQISAYQTATGLSGLDFPLVTWDVKAN